MLFILSDASNCTRTSFKALEEHKVCWKCHFWILPLQNMGKQQTLSLPKTSIHLDVPSSFRMHWSINRFRPAEAKLHWYRTWTLLFLYVRLIPSFPCSWALFSIHYLRNPFYWICLDAQRNSNCDSWVCNLHICHHKCKSNSS